MLVILSVIILEKRWRIINGSILDDVYPFGVDRQSYIR